ncbi:MAG: hypothetical protein ACR2RE_31700 [Geminicoccaceae bacterium]
MYDAGQYRAQITSQQFSETSNGNPQFVLSFRLLGMYDPTRPGELMVCQSEERSIFRAITDKTIDYWIEDLKSLGFDGGNFSCLDPSDRSHYSFADLEVDVQCRHETYEGQERERWSLSREGGSLQLKPLEAQGLRKLDALFGKKLGKPAASSPQPTQPEPDSVPSEEIPF